MKIDCQAVPAEDRGWMTEFFIQHWGSQNRVGTVDEQRKNVILK
ncbi:hypothetical protein [Brevibacillus sp. SYSU BS000544]